MSLPFLKPTSEVSQVRCFEQVAIHYDAVAGSLCEFGGDEVTGTGFLGVLWSQSSR